MSEEHADLRHDTSAPLSSRKIRFELIPYLHHEPIRHSIHSQLLIEDQKVEDGHPAKEADLEEGQRQEIGLRGADDSFPPVVPSHGSDREVLEDEAEGEGEYEI